MMVVTNIVLSHSASSLISGTILSVGEVIISSMKANIEEYQTA